MIIFIGLFSGVIYSIIVGGYYFYWKKIPLFVYSEKHNYTPQKAAIIIPARNEENNIEKCINSILQNEILPNITVEIIVIDDHSTDKTPQVLASFGPSVTVLQLKEYIEKNNLQNLNSYKKTGIEWAVRHSQADIILMTDADCIVPTDWIRNTVQYFELHTNTQCLAGAVNFTFNQQIITQFQALDFCGMMGVTGAGIISGLSEIGNGANLAFRKSAFDAVNGYAGVKKYASGDDVFLIQKIATQFQKGVSFLKIKNHSVKTTPMYDFSSFWQQRLRWATKNNAYEKPYIPIILGYIFIFCNAIIICLLSTLFCPCLGVAGLIMLSLKYITDRLFLAKMSHFFNQPSLMKKYFLIQCFHIFYIVRIGWESLFKKEYQWKGRTTS